MIQVSGLLPNRQRNKKKLTALKLFTTPFNKAAALLTKYKFVKQIARERHTLRHLSDHQLRDIGLTRNQIGPEINRSFLDLPQARLNEWDYRTGAGKPDHPISRTPKD